MTNKQITVWIDGRKYVGNPATGKYSEVKK
jgi:hypothetical protein